jgi:hypothetical protein
VQLFGAMHSCASASHRLQWYIENNGTTTWPFDLAADQLKQRLSVRAPDAPYGPGEEVNSPRIPFCGTRACTCDQQSWRPDCSCSQHACVGRLLSEGCDSKCSHSVLLRLLLLRTCRLWL